MQDPDTKHSIFQDPVWTASDPKKKRHHTLSHMYNKEIQGNFQIAEAVQRSEFLGSSLMDKGWKSSL